MRRKIVAALAAWYVSAAIVYYLLPPSAWKVATIDIAWLGPFVMVGLHLHRELYRGDASEIERKRPVRREATSEAPTYPKLLDRA